MTRLFAVLLIFSLAKGLSQNTESKTAQLSKSFDFIDNNSLKYEIGLVACDTCVPISNIGYRVILSLKDSQEALVKTLTFNDWSNLFKNPKKDWAANIVLYWLYDRDSYLIRRTKSNLWRKYLKKDEIKYWKLKFEKS